MACHSRTAHARITREHSFADRSLPDLTLGFDRVHSLLTPEPNAVGPQVVIGTSCQSLGPGATIPIGRRISPFARPSCIGIGQATIISILSLRALILVILR